MEHSSATKQERKCINPEQKAWHYIKETNSLYTQDLNKTALADGKARYTYGMMFRQWERYASVFSALGMTLQEHSRVGVMGSVSAETVFCFYGLNMVGAEVSLVAAFKALKPSRMIQTIKDEHLTDFIVTDDFAQPELLNELLGRKEELGLRNVLLLHLPACGRSVDPLMTAAQEAKYIQLKNWYAPICMDVLLEAYSDHPVKYAPNTSSETAFILHTTGTTSGTGNPIVLSDKAFNSVSVCFLDMKEHEAITHDPVSGMLVDMSNSYSMLNQIHVPLTLGGTVAAVPGGAMNPHFHMAVPEYGFTVLFAISALLEHWLRLPAVTPFDFSTLRYVVLGGTSVSAKDKKRYLEFFRRHGGDKVILLNGYGISELGGACMISTDDPDDESIGYPLPGVELRLYNEEEDKVYSSADAPCEGILYMTSPSVATEKLDGKVILDTRKIDGCSYVCTNDLVRIEQDGRVTFLGRANRYFLNNKGFKYEAGRVETEMARQAGIENCAMAPVYSKLTHDNIPMLCVQLLKSEQPPESVVCNALIKVFVTDKTLPQDHLPHRVMIVDELPKNGNGKVDLYRISRGDVGGSTYSVEPKKVLGSILSIRLSPVKDESSVDMLKEVFDEIKDDILLNNTTKECNEEMKDKRPYATGFRAMNELGSQFLKLIHNNPSCMGMPCMQQMMQNMMPNMQGMMQNMMPNMQSMMQGMMPNMQQGMMPNIMPNMQGMMQNMVPNMQAVMQNMMQTNQMIMQMIQQLYAQNCQLWSQLCNMQQNAGEVPETSDAPDEGETGKESE